MFVNVLHSILCESLFKGLENDTKFIILTFQQQNATPIVPCLCIYEILLKMRRVKIQTIKVQKEKILRPHFIKNTLIYRSLMLTVVFEYTISQQGS